MGGLLKLPFANLAVISETKLKHYLLSERHAVGKTKAMVFRRFGYSPDLWHILAEDLRNIALENELTLREESKFGIRFVIDGVLKTPSGRDFAVRTVWFIDNERQNPHFVTAYPR